MFKKKLKNVEEVETEKRDLLELQNDIEEMGVDTDNVESKEKNLTKKELKALKKSQAKEKLLEEKERKNQLLQEKKLKAKEKSIKPKKEKSEIYVIRKNKTMKILRFFFWAMLGFIFLKGVIVSIRPDPTAAVNKTIETFKADFSGYKDQDNEILAFAQNFAKEYLTYEIKGESDYIERLKPYASANITNVAYKFNGSAKAIYTQAYKKDTYSANQVDVYVLATLEYTTKETSEDKTTIIDKFSTEQAILKIPIQTKDNHYIVEDMPVFVNDDIKISDYTPIEFIGYEVTREETEVIKQALSNFFKAYYEEEQSVINYYLTNDADKTLFKGLNKRVLFNKIDSIRCSTIDGSSDIIAFVTLSITDINGVVVPQKFNLKIILKDNQYYIRTMDTRTININIK